MKASPGYRPGTNPKDSGSTGNLPRIFGLAFLLILPHANAAYGQTGVASLAEQLQLADPGEVNTLTLPPLELDKLRNNAFRPKDGTPLRFAEPFEVSITPDTHGTWQTVSHKGKSFAVWRLVVETPNAISLNFGFTRYRLPPESALFVYGADVDQRLRPFTELDNESHGQLWTPVIHARRVVLELNVPAERIGEVELDLAYINQGFLDILNLNRERIQLKSGSCNIDVVCPQAAGWEDQIRSVAVISTGGVTFCTGAAINNTESDLKPYFLTANHCGVDSSNAASLVTYWNYQNSTCRSGAESGQPGDGVLDQFNTGAIFRAAYAGSDMTLVELDDPYLYAANIFAAGWDRRDIAPASAVAIHHPSTDEKRISFENDPLSKTGDFGSQGDTHLEVADWDLGTTEPGSSGSPLFSPEKRIVGQLHGGGAACGNDLPDYYGRLFTSWSGGGTDETRLSSWLDMNNHGDTTMDGLDVRQKNSDFVSEAVEFSSFWEFDGDAGYSVVGPGEAFDGVDAIVSGDITHFQSSIVRTEINGPGNLSFYWRVSSEQHFDFLKFYIDGQLQDGISGNTDWAQYAVRIAPGPHTLEWKYMKDNSISSLDDAGYLDTVQYIADGICMPINTQSGVVAIICL